MWSNDRSWDLYSEKWIDILILQITNFTDAYFVAKFHAVNFS